MFRPTTRVLCENRFLYRIRHQALSRSLHSPATEKRGLPWNEATDGEGFTVADKTVQHTKESLERRPKDDTLTDSERAIFQQIYQDAAERSAKHHLSEEGRIEQLIGDTSQEQTAEEPLSTLFDRARDVIERNEKTRDRPPGVLDAERRPEADPRRVPPELQQNVPIIRVHNALTRPELPRRLSSSDRHSLQLALDAPVSKAVSDAKQPSDLAKLGKQDAAIVGACNKDAFRVQELLENAKTDSEIWMVLQEAVFKQAKLFLNALKMEHERADAKSSASSTAKKRRGQHSKKASTSELSSIRALSIATSPDKYPQLALPFAVIRANYAHHCWSALRILRVRFPRSPYATAVLPTIKSMGPISYVLGASTQLYNELLFLRWAHYRDLHACADLLAEMLDRGIPTNVWTSAVFRDAARRWLAASRQRKARKDSNSEAFSSTRDVSASSASNASSHQVRPFELAWWSLESVRSGFKRWEALEVQARRRHKEEYERKQRVLDDAEEDEHESEEAGEQAIPT